VQVRLLRVLQEGEVLPLGATRPEKVDVRVVAATHRDLEARVESEDFRADLYARLRGLRVHVPALQERPEDVGLLFAEGVRRTGAAPGALRLSRAAASALLACPWPHNVRQVMQVAATAVVLAEDGVIREEHLQGLSELQSVASSAGTVPTDPISTLVLAARHRQKDPERFREALLAVLAHVEGNLSRAAKETGFSRMQFYRWLETYGIER
jgi:transcriptional regulator of acetoin/glycerol metabolism